MAGAPSAMAEGSDGMPSAAEEEPTTAFARAGARSAGSTGAGRNVEVSGVGVGRPRTGALHYTAPSETGGVDERDEKTPAAVDGLTDEQLANTPKNAPCPCGSGKKFKMCHGRR